MRIVMIDLYTSKKEGKKVVSREVESIISRKMVVTLPYLSEEDKISEGISRPFLSIDRNVFAKTSHEKQLLKELRREASNKHPKLKTTLKDVFESLNA